MGGANVEERNHPVPSYIAIRNYWVPTQREREREREEARMEHTTLLYFYFTLLPDPANNK